MAWAWRGERLCGDARGDFGRCCRTRALLLDAISAGQVVLEDVRAARLAGLRTVACERLFLRSGARRAATAEMRGFVVRASLAETRSVFMRARGPPCPDAAPDLPQSWERAHYFVVVRHYDCKNGPAKLFNHLSATKLRRRAPPVLREQEGLDKDGGWKGWLVPCRTLALELCPQSIGRSPRLHSARQSSVRPAR